MSADRQSPLQSATIEVVIDAEPQAVYDAALAVASRLWAVGDDDIVTASPPTLIVHSVRLDGQLSCWLTWEVTPSDCGASQLRLVHDEADLRPAPPPELGEVVAVLNAYLVEAGSIPPQRPSDGVSP